MRELKEFKHEYLSWLSQNIETVTLSQDTVRLTAPFLDFNNDYTEIFIRKQGNSYLLTDYGETISNLELSNFRIRDNTKRSSRLKSLIASYGVVLRGDELIMECDESNFGRKANALMQCMLKVSNMSLLTDNK